MKKDKSLVREIQILTKNLHQHVIEVIGFLIDEQSKNCVGYVMPYMATGSLGDVIHNNGKSYDDIYTDEQKTSWITKTCRGLSHLHSNNIIHRDIKPREAYDDLKLSDFGIARSFVNMTHSLTKSIGTNPYMAPEMFKGEDYTFSADIYSFSLTIWEILHRRVPYGHITSEYVLHARVLEGERPELNDDLSDEVFDFLTRCWDNDATERPEIDEVLEFCSNGGFMYSKRIGTEKEEKTILLLGGRDEMNHNSLLMLEKSRENWKQLNTNLPHAIKSHGAQFLSNNLYIFGGRSASDKSINWTYKLSRSLQWEKIADMNEKREFISNSSVILNNQIWVCGGRCGNERLKSVEMYDPETKEWKYMREMNEALMDAGVAVVNGKIFCSGGKSRDYEELDSVECYDPSSDVWTRICDMQQAIHHHCAVEMDGNFIVIGGLHKDIPFKNVWVLDTTDESAEWIEKPSMSIPRKSFSIAKIRDKIFVCGGETKEVWKWKTLDSVEIFDEEGWKKGPKMPTSRHSAPAVVIPMQFARFLN